MGGNVEKKKKNTNTQKIEYLKVTFPIEKYVPKNSCEKPHIYLPPICIDVKNYTDRDLPDFPETIKSQVTTETFIQEYSTSLLPFSEFLSFFYLIAEVLADKKYPEIIVIGTHAGIVPLAISECFQCKIYYFTVKPLISQMKKCENVEIFHRFPNEKDFEKFRGLPLFNYGFYYDEAADVPDKINSQLYTYAYANYLLKAFQPIFSHTGLHLSRLETRPSPILPQGKLILIPYIYYKGECFVIETSGKFQETIYDFADVMKRLFIFTNCIRPLNYEHVRVSKIHGYEKIKKIADKIIGKPIDLCDLTREQYLQKSACYEKKYSFAPGKFVNFVQKTMEYKYSFYVDGIWYEMPKMKFIPFEAIHDIRLSEFIVIMRKEKMYATMGIIDVTVFENYKKLFLIGFFDLEKNYAYLIENESEIFLIKQKFRKIHFYMLSDVAKHMDLLKQKNFTLCKSKKDFYTLAAKKKYIVIEEDFYRPELVEPCALMLQIVWNNPYPRRCFIPDSLLLRNILATAFADVMIYVTSDNPKYDSMPQTKRIRNVEDVIESGDFLFKD